jgi:hypothetical protein
MEEQKQSVPGPSEAEQEQEENPVTHDPASLTAEELAAVRDLALRAYPETVPELVGGNDLASLLGSLEAAQAAYRRIAEGVTTQAPATAPAVPTVPAGSAPPVAIDPDHLPPVEKIRRALASRA